MNNGLIVLLSCCVIALLLFGCTGTGGTPPSGGASQQGALSLGDADISVQEQNDSDLLPSDVGVGNLTD